MKTFQLILFILFTNLVFAQETSIAFKYLSFVDQPMSKGAFEDVDLEGTSVDFKPSFGRTFIIEGTKEIKPSLSLILGVGTGRRTIRLTDRFVQEFPQSPFQREVEDGPSILYFSSSIFYSGLTYIKTIKDYFCISAGIRAGVISPQQSNPTLTAGSFEDGQTINRREVSFRVNERGTVFPIIIPDASVSFKIPSTNLSFSAGISSVIRPISYFDAELRYFGEESELTFNASENKFAFGLLFGLNYVFGNPENQ